MLEIEDKGMDEFRETLSYFERNFPRETSRMMLKVGNKVRTIVRREARQKVKKNTGNFLKSIKRGKVFVNASNEMTVRVYPSAKIAPHAHLIERGHRIVTKSGEEVGFAKGKYVFESAQSEIEREYTKIVEQELDKAFRKL